jgi:DNA repair protein RadA/Sms
MVGVDNPSQLFLSERQTNAPGSVVVATVEGSRPLLIEVQALCAPSYFTAPRRTVTGADFNRVNVALAVIEKRLGMRLGDMDVYVNVSGGVRAREPALDLGIALAVISSLHDVPVPPDACVFGEVGLAGEVRAVSHADRRAMEAARLGFGRCIMPRAALQNLPPEARNLASQDSAVRLQGVATLRDAVTALLPQALGKKREMRKRPDAARPNSRDEMLDPSSNTGPFAWPARDEYGDGYEEYTETPEVSAATGEQ